MNFHSSQNGQVYHCFQAEVVDACLHSTNQTELAGLLVRDHTTIATLAMDFSLARSLPIQIGCQLAVYRMASLSSGNAGPEAFIPIVTSAVLIHPTGRRTYPATGVPVYTEQFDRLAQVWADHSDGRLRVDTVVSRDPAGAVIEDLEALVGQNVKGGRDSRQEDSGCDPRPGNRLPDNDTTAAAIVAPNETAGAEPFATVITLTRASQAALHEPVFGRDKGKGRAAVKEDEIMDADQIDCVKDKGGEEEAEEEAEYWMGWEDMADEDDLMMMMLPFQDVERAPLADEPIFVAFFPLPSGRSSSSSFSFFPCAFPTHHSSPVVPWTV